MGEGGKVAVSVIDAGYGKLTSTDKLTIYGSVQQEIVIEPIEYVNDPTVITATLLANDAGLVINENLNRKGLILFNGSSETIYIGYSDTVIDTNYSIRLSSGKGYEFPQPMYVGEIWAYALNAATLQATEFKLIPAN